MSMQPVYPRRPMSPRVRLRDVREDDLPIFFEHQTDPEANGMANLGARDRDAFMAHWAKILRDDAVVVRSVEWEGLLAGNVVSWVHDEERDVGSIRVLEKCGFANLGPVTVEGEEEPELLFRLGA